MIVPAIPNSELANCVLDNQPEGGSKLCHKSNIMYEWKCELCDGSYIGETSSIEHADLTWHLIQHHSKDTCIFLAT